MYNEYDRLTTRAARRRSTYPRLPLNQPPSILSLHLTPPLFNLVPALVPFLCLPLNTVPLYLLQNHHLVPPPLFPTSLHLLLAPAIGQSPLLREGVPAPTVEWSSYTGNISVNVFINVTRLRAFANGSLEISDLTQKDDGVYACTASNSVGTDIVYIVLINSELYPFRKLCSIWSGLYAL